MARLTRNESGYLESRPGLEIYFNARTTILHSNLVETTFEELAANRLGTIVRICEKFSIKPPANFEALKAKAQHARQHGLPPDSWLPLIHESYKPLFDAGPYPQP